MPTYCEIGDKAIVTLTKNGASFEIVSNNAPISVNCKNTDYGQCVLCDVEVQYQNMSLSGVLGSIETSTVSCYSPISGIRIVSNASIQIYCRGGSSGGCSNPNWYTFFQSGVFNRYANAQILSVTPKQSANSNNKGVIIRDKDNQIIFDDNTVDCNWSVKCGDDCPTGQIKCSCNKFPGYCCVSCNEIKTEIKNAAAMIRSLNNG